MARFKFGGGRVGEARNAAEIKVGMRGAEAPSRHLGADIPAMLRKDGPAALRGQLDFVRGISTIGNHEADIPLKVN